MTIALRQCPQLIALLLLLVPWKAFSDDVTAPSPSPASLQVETIVCIRHGEKPPSGIGNLEPQGLNRALALPDALLKQYGKPAFIFAPDPWQDLVTEGPLAADGTSRMPVSYVRPLITIAPMAIRLGLPINANFGFRHIADLEQELEKPAYHNSLILIAWEHIFAEKFMRSEIIDHGGQGNSVPVWEHNDFDSIYVAEIIRQSSGKTIVTFRVDHENLNGESPDFPQPASKQK